MTTTIPSKKYLTYAEALRGRKVCRDYLGYKTGRIFTDWQGFFSFMVTK